MLAWFDHAPDRYWWLALPVLLLAAGLALRAVWRRDAAADPRFDWRWSLLLVAVLAAGRWPTWRIAHELNSDESQFLAGALTLRHDPVFWRSVDGMTVGPLDFYALLPAGWLHGRDDYFSGRLTAALLLAAALILAYHTLSAVYGRAAGRIATLPTACLEAFTLHKDLLHYSSELVPVALLALALCLLVRRGLAGSRWGWNLLAGLALGAVPLAKLQAVPAAAVLGAAGLAAEAWAGGSRPAADRLRAAVALLAGAIAPAALAMIALNVFGLASYAATAYVRHNLAYVETGDWSLANAVTGLWLSADRGESLLLEWLAGGVLVLLVALPVAGRGPPRARIVAAGLAGFLAVCALAAITPRRASLHYLQLVVIPWTLLTGAAAGLLAHAWAERPARRRYVLGGLLALGVGLPLAPRLHLPPPAAGRLVYYQLHPRGAAAEAVAVYARPGECLGIWGWASNLYVETGLRQATRRADSSAEITPGPFLAFFRGVYLDDLHRSAPPVFVDATGPGNYAFDDRKWSFETTFPALADFIRRHYVSAREVDGMRLYVRRDRWLAPGNGAGAPAAAR